jgi:zinc protease
MSQSRRVLHLALACVMLAPSLAAQAGAASAESATMLSVGGVRIIHERRAGSPVVAARLYLLGGSRQVTAANAGIEPMILRAAQFGSARYPGNAARTALARTGAAISYEVTNDWIVATLSTTPAELDSAWAVFADGVVAPSLESPAIESVRRRMLTDRLAAEGGPNGPLWEMLLRVGYAGHPYAAYPGGSDGSLRAISVLEAQDYHRTQFVSSRMLLVIVGDVERAQVERLVERSLSSLPAGNYSWTLPPPLPKRSTAMTLVPRKQETDYVIGFYSGPVTNSRDFGAFRFVTALLGARVYNEVRERLHLAYDAGGPMFDDAATAGAVYFTTSSPERALDATLIQVQQLVDQGFPREVMPWFTRQFAIARLTEAETADGQASALARGQLLFGDFRAVDAANAAMSKVSEGELSIAARRYLPNITWVFVGDTARFRKYMR